MNVLLIYPDLITNTINYCPAFHILSAVLKRAGHEVNMLHINNENGIKYDKKTIVKLSKGWDLFALTSTSFNYKHANEIAGWLHEAYPQILSILGGSHATIQPEDFMASNFDIFCIGEGEEALLDLVNALESGADWAYIPNLVTSFSSNPVRPFIRDLDSLPYHDFEITDTEKILKLRNGFLNISFSRGCSYECTFCINHLYKKIEMQKGDKISEYLRRRSPRNTVDELVSLANKYEIKYFNTDDDLLVMDKRWMREFTQLYTEEVLEPYGIKYLINARATSLNEEIVKMLASSGCHEVRVGFETGNEKLRNELLSKRTSNEALIKAFALLKQYDVRSLAFTMMGIPGESWETFYDTVDMIIKLQPTLIRMTYLFPYKHTKIYDYCVENDLFKEGEIDNEFTASPLKFKNITDKDLFLMRFLFPWYLNTKMLAEGWFKYEKAIDYFIEYPLSELEKRIPKIIARDKELDKQTIFPHYRYFSDNDTYFELYDNKQNSIQD